MKTALITATAFLLALPVMPALAAEGEAAAHIDPIASVILSLAIILLGLGLLAIGAFTWLRRMRPVVPSLRLTVIISGEDLTGGWSG